MSRPVRFYGITGWNTGLVTSRYRFNGFLFWTAGALAPFETVGVVPCGAEVLASGAADVWASVDAGGIMLAVDTDAP